VLPLGTLNLLARDLGMSTDLQANLAFIATQNSRPIDLGEVNGRLFHSNAGLGFFAMMAREREVARRRFPFSKAMGFAFAALRTTLFSKTITVELEVAGQSVTMATDAVLVTNNRFAGTPWRRASMDEGLLEVHTLQAPGLLARLRAAIAVARGTWRDLPSLTSFTAPNVTLTRRGRTRAIVAIDGEIHRLANPLRFTVRQAALPLPGMVTPPGDISG
jgi:diacylglycerol kinase family enzyme